ncbi:MAG TPA: putative sugar nucleotidyl transferase, partial [Pirellulales bacterium]|nr:putative sugar nucleotidyl transferase [Pirellulales bacterium]
MMLVVLFEDEHVAALDPIALGKPAFAVTCGSYRLVDLVAGLTSSAGARVRGHLAAVVAADFPHLNTSSDDPRGQTLWLNARMVPSVDVLDKLRLLLAAGKPGVARSGKAISAALLEPGSRLGNGLADPPSAADFAALGLDGLDLDLPLFEHPHDVIRHHLTTLGGNLEHRIAAGDYQQVADGVFVAAGAVLGQPTVTDTRRGPIVIESGATIGPFCYLSGPVHVGPAARVLEHAALKD